MLADKDKLKQEQSFKDYITKYFLQPHHLIVFDRIITVSIFYFTKDMINFRLSKLIFCNVSNLQLFI